MSEQPSSGPSPSGPPSSNGVKLMDFLRRTINLDVVFLALLVLVFIGMIWEARDFRFPAGQMPTLIASVGLALIVIHAFQQIRRKGGIRRRILDIGYESYAEGVDTPTVWRRSAEFLLSMGVLFGAVWLLGFHVGAPLFVFAYLKVLGRADWWIALWPAIAVWLAVVLVYGVFANAIWHVSVAERMLDVNFQDMFEAPFGWLR